MRDRAVSVWFFPLVGAAILFLALVSFLLSYLDLGRWAVTVALTIASIQVVILAWYSMELFESRFSVRMLAIIAPLFVVLLISLAVADLASRVPPPLIHAPPQLGEEGFLPGTAVEDHGD